MDWLRPQTVKNGLRIVLGARLYGGLVRTLRPKRRVSVYGDRLIETADEGGSRLAAAIEAGQPFASGKVGSTELKAWMAVRALGPDDDLPKAVYHQLHLNAGVFPQERQIAAQFADEFEAAVRALDLIAVWFNPGEQDCVDSLAPGAALCRLQVFDPYFQPEPWTQALAGRRVVVVSPFARSIAQQFARREQVWASRPGFLPDCQLRTVRAPLSDYLAKSPFPDWPTALEHLKGELLAEPFDVALIGAGAFSLPLAAAAKAAGAAGIHLGGTTQVLFGVRGGRWDANDQLAPIMNEHWIRPSADEVPESFRKVEGGCYW